MPDHASITPEAGLRPSPTPRTKRRWPILLGGIMLLLQGCATTPSSPPSDEARTQAKIAYLLSDYQRTLTIVLPRAEAGEAWAQYTLGYMYYYGHGVRQDRKTAKRWIESAAAKGYAPAQQAMLRLSAPPPRTGEEGNADTMQEPADATVTPPPATEPATPQMTAPLQETNPPASSSEPPISPPPPPPPPAPPETAPAPGNEPVQPPNPRNHRPIRRRHQHRHRLLVTHKRPNPMPPYRKPRKSKVATGSHDKTRDISHCSLPAASTKRRSSALSTNSALSKKRLIIRPG